MSFFAGVKNDRQEIAMSKMLSCRPPRIALAYLAVAMGLHYLSPPGTVLHFPYRLLGTVFSLAGVIIMTWAWVLFQREKTVVCPTGQATTLIESGPYLFTRNPMYLGMLFIQCGAGFLLGSVIAFSASIAFFITMNEVFIPFEERNMERTFGEEYRNYRERIRRWI